MPSQLTSRASSSSSLSSLNKSRRQISAAQHEYLYALPDTSISEWLRCPICLNPFVEPTQVKSCEHIFCRACINMHLDNKSSHHNGHQSDSTAQEHGYCPSCRALISTSDLKPSAALIRNMVDSLLVKCPHERRGCSYTCERSLVDMHARRDCGWAWIGEYSGGKVEGGRATSKGRCECGKRVYRKDWQAHFNEGDCSVNRVRCPYADFQDGCNQMLKESEMEEHLTECSARPVHCEHCNSTLQKIWMGAHEMECPEATIGCTFARFGCPWHGRRKELNANHLPQCQLVPLKDYLVNQEEEVGALQRENAILSQMLRSMKDEQDRMSGLLERCVSSLGAGFFESDTVALHQEGARSPGARSRSDSLAVPIRPPHTLGRPPSSPPITLRGRSGSTTAAAADVHHPDLHEDIFLASSSAPASRADLPWQWPEPGVSASSSEYVRQLPSMQVKTISSCLAEMDSRITSIFEQMKQMDRRVEDNHIAGLNANFEASRAHEELNSVRHGLHALRISLMMQQQQQQRGMPGPAPPEARGGEGGHPSSTSAMPNMSFSAVPVPVPGPSMMGFRRFWTGFEQTKL